MSNLQEPHGLLTTLNQVGDKDSFLNFVRELIKDRSNPGNWENDSIESFLGAALAWAEDSDMGQSQGMTEEQVWKKFAVFLYCGKIYE